MVIEIQNSWILSKTLFLKGRQCVKSMYLHKNHRELAKASDQETKRITHKGFRFEDQFRKERFPYGIDLKKEFGTNYTGIIDTTSMHINKNEPITLFEAGIVFNQVLVLVDVLFLKNDGTIEIFEIKNSSVLKPEVLWDASLQYYVCKGFFGDRLKGFHVVLQGSRNRFKQIEITQQAEKKQESIESEVERFLNILKENEVPKVLIGDHCYKPHTCGFLGYCSGNLISKF